MKFTVKIGKIDGVKSDGKVEWKSEKKAGEIKIRYEDSQKIFVVGLGKVKDLTTDELQKISAKLGKRVKEEEIKNLALSCFKTGSDPVMDFTEALVLGLLLGEYEFKKYKTDKGDLGNMGEMKEREITILAKNANELVKIKEAVKKAEIYSQAVCLARDLVNEPSSLTTPKYLADLAQKMAKTDGFSCKVYDEKEIEKMGMGCLMGVAKGSDEPARFIKLTYGNGPTSPRLRGTTRTIVLVGKGITFDTGGLSLKTSEGMETMKMDMAGAASVLAIFSVLAKLKIKGQVIGLIPATENMPSGKAIKPGDILKSYSGKTVEVLNTDAEGRLILADALSYGVTLKPDMMIDLATLTGACMVALGEEIAGLFTKDEKLKTGLLQAANNEGEKIWPMPLEKSYEELLKSEVADLKNVTGKHYAGAITAALFLREFVGSTIWAHLDIAGPAWAEKGTDLIPKGGSGFGVRTILNFLQNYL